MAVTIKKLADELHVPVGSVKTFLRGKALGESAQQFASPSASVTRSAARALRSAGSAGVREYCNDHGSAANTAAEEAEPVATDADIRELPEASTADSWLPPRSDGGYPIYVHQDVLDALGDHHTPVTIKKAVTRRVQELMAHGRATRMKGTSGHNAGWLRIPLGGNSGFHDYLWLLNQGEKVARQDTGALFEAFPPRARLLRAIRHHDDTGDLLRVGAPNDYAPLSALDAQAGEEGGILTNPLVPAQHAIVTDSARVRLVQGQPGAGKTTALHTSSTRLQGRALYLTWSEHLVAPAREWFDAHAPRDLDVTFWTFSDFLAALDPRDSGCRSRGVAEGARRLRSLLGTHARELGPWWRDGQLRAEELFAELRAHYVGSSLPIQFRDRRCCQTARMADADYARSREKLGEAAIEGLLAAARTLTDDDLRALFPQPVAAFHRALALQSGELRLDPARFSFESVLVDEVQDLTLVEQWLLVDVIARSGAHASVRPNVVIAGDESQTVRATGFDWACLADLVYGRLGGVSRHEHVLSANLRSPSEVADVIRRARKLYYRDLPKGRRPRGRTGEQLEDATVGRVLKLAAPDDEALTTLLRAFGDGRADAALIYPGPVVPARLAELARSLDTNVWTADEAKGLEFRIVAVLGMDHALREITQMLSAGDEERLACELARAAIDRLVVALSRTTETLVVVADAWDDEASALVDRLLRDEVASDSGAPVMQVSCEDVLELVHADAADVRERIEALVLQSQQLLDVGSSASASSTASRCVALLGRPDRPGAAGAELRRRARRQLGRCLATCALEEIPPASLTDAARLFALADERTTAVTLRHAEAALRKDPTELATNKALRALVRELDKLGQDEGALRTRLVLALRERIESLVESRTVPGTPKRRASQLEAVTALAEHAPSDRDAFAAARVQMIVNMLGELARSQAGKTEYEALRKQVEDHPELPTIDAQRLESLGDYAEAACRWEALKRRDDAFRCRRLAGELREAHRLAPPNDAPGDLLQWGTDILDLLEKRPEGDLTDAERETLKRELAARL